MYLKVRKEKNINSTPWRFSVSVPCVSLCHFLQHLQDMLELDMSALAFMMKNFPEIKEVEDMRKSIGRYGLTGKQQVCTSLEATAHEQSRTIQMKN